MWALLPYYVQRLFSAGDFNYFNKISKIKQGKRLHSIYIYIVISTLNLLK